MTLPGMGSRRDPGETARVKALVVGLIGAANATVLVTELECSEPGCPPVETVIALLSDDGNAQCKVHKPVTDVTFEDVRSALNGGDPVH
jgi:hypothetical protein